MSNNSKKNCPTYEDLDEIATYIKSKTTFRPKVGVVCGSGLGTLVNQVENQVVIPYSTIPGFPQSTVVGHAGNLVFGNLSGSEVVLMQGRVHLFEGYTANKCTIPIRVMHLLGVTHLFLTNASGGLQDDMKVGDVVFLKDHINFPGLSGDNPLVGPNDTRFGERFVALSDSYDRDLLKLAHKVSAKLGWSQPVREGVYVMQAGPTYMTVVVVVSPNARRAP